MKIPSPYYTIFNPEKEEYKDVSSWYNTPVANFSVINFFFSDDKKLHKSYNTETFLYFNKIKKLYELEISDPLSILPQSYLDNEFNFYDLTSFFFLKKSSFISFFIENFIDVPICFKKSKSLKRKNFELNLFKFTNFLMRRGQKEKTVKLLNLCFFNFFFEYKKDNLWKNTTVFDWLDFFFFFNNSFKYFNDKIFNNFLIDKNLPLFYNNLAFPTGKLIQANFFVKNYMLSRLTPVLPVFSYFIYNVDKNVRKFSRGKSGKYLFVWKYIAPYKRLYITFRWILKDIRFDVNTTLVKKLENVFLNLTKNPEETFAWKSKNYTYAHIFKNLRKSLMSTLRTVSK